MVRIVFVQPDSSQTEVEGAAGESIMQAAVSHGIPGVIGECGGSMACATCHCYVDADWLPRTGALSPGEEDMLDLGMAEPRPESRLTCQIRLTPELDGIVIHVPDAHL